MLAAAAPECTSGPGETCTLWQGALINVSRFTAPGPRHSRHAGMSARCCVRAWQTGLPQLSRPRAPLAKQFFISQPAHRRPALRMASGGSGGCSKDTPKLSAEELDQKVQSLPNWRIDEGKTSISRSFVARNFTAAIAFFQKVADVAEAANHHPDLHLTNYRDVQVVLSTHAIGGVSEIDLKVAAQLDALDVDYSPKWLKQQHQS